jgi:hypothetical protein
MKEMEQTSSMKMSNLAKYAVCVTTAAALLAGCSSGGGSMLSPTATSNLRAHQTKINGLLTLAAHPAGFGVGMQRLGALMRPEKKAKSKLQYISNFYNSTVLQFNYPKGGDASTGSIPDVEDAQGECTGKLYGNGKKTWWVTASGSDEVIQYTIDGTATGKTLSVTAGEPAGCAINPMNGDLAETILSSGDVVIFTNASGSGTEVPDGLAETFFAGYDNKGDLYVDGYNESFTFGIAELPAGSTTFEQLTTSNSVEFQGAVQFDGTYITVNDQEAHEIYQYTQSGTTLTEHSSTALDGSSDCVQTWIAKKYVICPDAGNDDGEIYAYPAGGSAQATLSGDFDLPIGAVAVKGKT